MPCSSSGVHSFFLLLDDAGDGLLGAFGSEKAEGVGLAFDEAETKKVGKGEDEALVDLKNDVALSHACLVGLALVPDEADGGASLLGHEGNAKLAVGDLDGGRSPIRSPTLTLPSREGNSC